MKNEKLMRAIGRIDEDLILEARQTVRPRRKYVRFAALAASLMLIVLAAPVVFIGTMGAGASKAEMEDEIKSENLYANGTGNWFDIIFNFDVSSDGQIKNSVSLDASCEADESIKFEAESPSLVYPMGDEVVRIEGTLLLSEMTETTIRLYLIKNTDSELVIKVGILCDSEETKEAYVNTFPADEIDIYVNGDLATELPYKKGEYDIVLDFTKLLANPELTLARQFTVEGFGVFGELNKN